MSIIEDTNKLIESANKKEVRYIDPSNLDKYDPKDIVKVKDSQGNIRYKRKGDTSTKQVDKHNEPQQVNNQPADMKQIKRDYRDIVKFAFHNTTGRQVAGYSGGYTDSDKAYDDSMKMMLDKAKTSPEILDYFAKRTKDSDIYHSSIAKELLDRALDYYKIDKSSILRTKRTYDGRKIQVIDFDKAADAIKNKM